VAVPEVPHLLLHKPTTPPGAPCGVMTTVEGFAVVSETILFVLVPLVLLGMLMDCARTLEATRIRKAQTHTTVDTLAKKDLKFIDDASN
jgi:hypothetical protein